MSAQPARVLRASPRPSLSLEAAPARLAVQGMHLSFADRVALADVSFEVGAGQIFGILGPNGSGKSSLMRCLTGQLRPDHGTVWLDGAPIVQHAQALRARMGVVFQDPSLDPQLSVRHNLHLAARLYAVAPAVAQTRAAELLSYMGLTDWASARVDTLSGGMRRRLELARALIHRPQLLLLDEPTTGLDLGAFDRTWQLLGGLRRTQALTVVISTHRPDEAERCDRLLVLDRGRVIACDSPQGLLKRVVGDVIDLEADEPEALATEIMDRLGVLAHVHGAHVVLEREQGHTFVPQLVESFAAGRIRSIAVRQPSLADAFFHLTGHGLADVREPRR